MNTQGTKNCRKNMEANFIKKWHICTYFIDHAWLQVTVWWLKANVINMNLGIGKITIQKCCKKKQLLLIHRLWMQPVKKKERYWRVKIKCFSLDWVDVKIKSWKYLKWYVICSVEHDWYDYMVVCLQVCIFIIKLREWGKNKSVLNWTLLWGNRKEDLWTEPNFEKLINLCHVHSEIAFTLLEKKEVLCRSIKARILWIW